jgi:hypothetical protein
MPCEWKVVASESMKNGCPPESAMTSVYSFHPRDPTYTKADRALQPKAFNELSERLALGIESAIANLTKDLSRALVSAFHRAYLMGDGTYARSTLHVMTETVRPLLRDDLTVSETVSRPLCLIA